MLFIIPLRYVEDDSPAIVEGQAPLSSSSETIVVKRAIEPFGPTPARRLDLSSEGSIIKRVGKGKVRVRV